MAEVEKLTKAELDLIPKVRDEWLQKFLSLQFDEEKAVKFVNYIYELSNLQPPQVIVCDSPMDCQYRANLWPEKPAEGKTAKETLKAKSKKPEYISFSFYGFAFDYGWCAFYDYFKRIGKVQNDQFDKYISLLDCNIFLAIYLRDAAFISRPPKNLMRDQNGRMHCKTGPCMEFQDGYSVFSVDGVRFHKKLYGEAFLSKMKAKDILQISNAEQRAAVIKHYGYDYIMTDKSIKPKVIDTLECKSKVTGNPCHYEVMDFEIDRAQLRVVKVEDHTTHKTVTLGVPREDSTKSCMGAIAWTFGKAEKDYNPILEG